MSLRNIVFGTAAMSLVNVLRLFAQLFALPLLARRLSPSDYGIVGMATPFLAFAMMIADAGVGMSLVRSSATNRGVWSTCYWLSVLLGAALATVMFGLAPLAAFIFHEPRLGPIIMTLGLVVVAETLTAIPMTMLQQKHRFNVIAAIETVAVITGIGTAVVIALHGGGAWALVDQQLAYFAVRLTATFLASPFRPLMILNLRSAREHLLFSRDIISVNFINFFSRSLDNLVIGKGINVAAVGVYAMASQFIRLPLMVVTGPLQYVLYAQLAGSANDLPAVRRLFLVLTRSLATLGFPLIGIVAAAHHPIFTLLLSEKWARSGEIFLLLAPVSALLQLTALSGTIMLALGRTDIQLRTTVEFGFIWITTLLTSVRFGLEWTAIAYSCAVILYTPRSLMLALPLMECPALLYTRALIIPSIVTCGCIAGFWELNRLLLFGQWAQLYLGAALAVVGVMASALGQHRAFLDEFALWQRRDHRGKSDLVARIT